MRNKNYFLGIIFVLAAVSMLLGNFHFFYPISTVKVLITVLLLYIIVKNIPYRNYFNILVPAAFIFILYDDFLPFTILTPFSVLAAAVLGSIGLSFLFPNHSPLKAYFDHAEIIGTSADIYVDNSFGETNLFLPKEWDVHIDASTTFGDITEIHKSPSISDDAPLVSIHGNISFGDCKIFYI